jgi:hypothetical protein
VGNSKKTRKNSKETRKTRKKLEENHPKDKKEHPILNITVRRSRLFGLTEPSRLLDSSIVLPECFRHCRFVDATHFQDTGNKRSLMTSEHDPLASSEKQIRKVTRGINRRIV